MNFPNLAHVGVVYDVSVLRKDGRVTDHERVHNIVPLLGLNHIIGVTLKQAAAAAAWYIGIYEGNYTPVLEDAAATFPAVSTECTAYDEATRELWVGGAVSGGAVDNGASEAEFTMNAVKTIYGAFMSSASAKSAVSGTLLSAAKFATPKVLGDGDVLRVIGAFSIVNEE